VCVRAIHAERNVLTRIPLPPAIDAEYLYTTESPCLDCARLILGRVAIERVYYQYEYRLKDGIDYLVNNLIDVFRMTPGGYVINYKTGELDGTTSTLQEGDARKGNG
jgi:deoxycytidylate deaminase